VVGGVIVLQPANSAIAIKPATENAEDTEQSMPFRIWVPFEVVFIIRFLCDLWGLRG